MVVIKFDDVASQNLREWTEAGYIYIVIVDNNLLTFYIPTK
jgi:hypothetical protein